LQLPASFIQSLQTAPGFDESAFLATHQLQQQLTSIRINPAKNTNYQTYKEDTISTEKIPWSNNGLYLSSRPSFTLDPLFHAGAYYVQEASSMFLEEAVKQSIDLSQPLKVLDLCAAPGGKSTLLQSIISDKSLLVSNEVIKTRVNILAENITKWGAANVVVTNNDPKDFQRLSGFFDVIVVDAPCSGSGLFRKDAAAINEWSLQNVMLCSQRQQRITADILPALKDGGLLIYSTCSYSEAEDEGIADWMITELHLESLALKIESSWGIIETQSPHHKAFGYRFYPDKVKGEGFFIAAFKKAGKAEFEDRKTGKNKLEKLSKKEVAVVAPWLCNPDEFIYIKQHEEAIAIPLHLENDLATIQKHLYIKKAGVKLGQVVRDELIPDHQLAISSIISPSIPSVEVDKETALQYLRKQDVTIDSSTKGWAMLTYQQQPLGWVKILPNRINNYYPKEWRILNK
jgi:16S rRNA C967 or C1407 C5-methylase (RsmB/RsmF family)/NOL1/NOP2/fmu family ribosome biogenesis protein